MREFTMRDQPIMVCVSCRRFFAAGRWTKDLTRMLAALASEPVRIIAMHPEEAFATRIPKRVGFELSFTADGEEHIVEVDVPVEKAQCDACTKERSHYFEGFLQLRAGTEDEYRIARRILEANRGHVKAETKRKGGVDFKVSSNRAITATLKELANRYVGTATVSSTLHTHDRQSSKEKHRVTGLFRFSKLSRGTVLIVSDALFILEKMKGSLVELRSIGDGRTTMTIPLDEAESKERVEPFETSVIATRPALLILSESYGDVTAQNRSGAALRPDDRVRAVGWRGSYAVLERL